MCVYHCVETDVDFQLSVTICSTVCCVSCCIVLRSVSNIALLITFHYTFFTVSVSVASNV